MKIAVSSDGKNLDSQIDPRFGRCRYFLIAETEDMSFEACENENASLGGGAGIQSAQFVVSRGANDVITGNCGPNALRTLNAAGVKVFLGQGGTVKEALQRYKNGELSAGTEPNVAEHFGMGRGGGRPGNVRGSGAGRGMGMGRGMGGGQGMGGGMGKRGGGRKF
jgi:predicted Fe-Mo cluster-binding NifX family protein